MGLKFSSAIRVRTVNAKIVILVALVCQAYAAPNTGFSFGGLLGGNRPSLNVDAQAQQGSGLFGSFLRPQGGFQLPSLQGGLQLPFNPNDIAAQIQNGAQGFVGQFQDLAGKMQAQGQAALGNLQDYAAQLQAQGQGALGNMQDYVAQLQAQGQGLGQNFQEIVGKLQGQGQNMIENFQNVVGNMQGQGAAYLEKLQSQAAEYTQNVQ